jgi:hypothetical protein
MREYYCRHVLQSTALSTYVMQYTMCAYVENYLAWILLPCGSVVFLTLISNHLDL